MRVAYPFGMRAFDFLIANGRWLLAGGLIALASGFGQTFFISIFAAEIMAAFALTDGQWGGIYTLATASSAVVMLWAGTLSDRFRARELATIVLLMLAGACLFMAFNRSAWALVLAIFALRFTGQGMLSHVSVVAVARWFVRARGKALAISTLGFSFAEAFLPMIFVALLSAYHWRNLWIAAAVVSLLYVPIMLLLMRTERTPQSMAAEEGATGIGGRHWSRVEVLRHGAFWMLVPALVAPSFFVTALFFQQVHLAASKGWDHAVFVSLFPVFTGTAVLTNLGSGWAVDRFGCRRLMPIFLLPMAAGFLVFARGQDILSAAVAFCLVGASGGAASSLVGAFWPETYGTRHLGAIKALVTAMTVLGSALGPGLTGWLIDLGTPFKDQMAAYAVYLVLVSGLAGLAMRRLSRAA
jgi:MFS family permease